LYVLVLFMSDHSDMSERHGRVLAELAETGMTMVRRLSDAMARTDDVQTLAQLGMAFHRVSRAVRQTLALESRLAHEARREDRGVDAPVRTTPPERATPPEPATPREPAERTNWNEYESDDDHEALEELDALLEAEDLDLEAVHEAVETCIARIRHDLDAEPAEVVVAAEQPAAAPAPWRASPRPPGPGGRRSELMSATAFAWRPGAGDSS
jgi:hypothetical protein